MPFLSLTPRRRRSPWRCATALLLARAVFFLVLPLRAVEVSGNFLTTTPGAADIPHWTGGWPGPGLSGWNYVGQVLTASGIYLGNGWVLTAAHVGAAAFTLDGVTYPAVSGSEAVMNHGHADLLLFQIASPPALPALRLRQLPPVPFAAAQAGDAVAMIGFGGGHGKTWGVNTVTGIHDPIAIFQYSSIDFYTTHGTTTLGGQSVTNDAHAVSGDSGGAAFLYHADTGSWELAGLMEATGDATFFVQIDTYVQEILDITGLVAPPVIERDPSGASVYVGAPVTLSVAANGTSPLTYQWLKNGATIPGATTATLAFDTAASSDSGSYRATVTNAHGSITSSPATVTVTTPVPALPAWALAILPVLLFAICHRRLISP